MTDREPADGRPVVTADRYELGWLAGALGPATPHVMYAGDALVFERADVREARRLEAALHAVIVSDRRSFAGHQ